MTADTEEQSQTTTVDGEEWREGMRICERANEKSKRANPGA